RIGRFSCARRARHRRFPSRSLAGSGVDRSCAASSTSTRWQLEAAGQTLCPRSGTLQGIPSLAWVLLEVLDTLGLERVVLVGNSMGGPVCLEVAHSAPERVAGIVLASPAGGMHNQPLVRALMQLVRD